VIAFPKTQSGGDLMIDAPGPIDEKQITDCGMKVTLIEKKRQIGVVCIRDLFPRK